VTELPVARTPGSYRIALVCLGNICRSPMADVVLSARVDESGLSGRVVVDSCGTGDWHVDGPMDERAAATLTAAGYDATQHRARQFAPTWLDDHDLVLAMDSSNLADIGGRSSDGRVRLFRDLDPVDPGGEVPDPYYGGDAGFEEVLTMVERTSAAIVAALQRQSASGWTAS
jgi:protein-tyrosine phosphatase